MAKSKFGFKLNKKHKKYFKQYKDYIWGSLFFIPLFAILPYLIGEAFKKNKKVSKNKRSIASVNIINSDLSHLEIHEVETLCHENKEPEACLTLAHRLKGLHDYELAHKLFKADCVNRTKSKSCYHAGILEIKAKNKEEFNQTKEILEINCNETKVINSCVVLGVLHEKKKNFSEAKKYLKIACNSRKESKQQTLACYLLGSIFTRDNISSQDGIRYFKRACRSEYEKACNALKKISAGEKGIFDVIFQF